MAETKMVVVAILLVAMLVASSAPAVEAHCIRDCYNRCANGKAGNDACTAMCTQACIIPKTISAVDDRVKFGVPVTGGIY